MDVAITASVADFLPAWFVRLLDQAFLESETKARLAGFMKCMEGRTWVVTGESCCFSSLYADYVRNISVSMSKDGVVCLVSNFKTRETHFSFDVSDKCAVPNPSD